ncbi:MAG: helix-turn-helix transcriptional regulator [Variibacter sp.]|nr:helix-turn-helix transcriptional regulator [Variibacter sp.]
MELLTSAEAAAYLRLKERKLYDLVARRAVPCTKVTGRWLFPKADLDRWVLSGLERPPGLARAEPMPIVGGSHDPLMEWALRESGSGLAILAEGSEAGLARFLAGGVVAAAVHLHALGEPERDANADALRERPGLQDAVLIAFVRREQGLLVARGNPLSLGSLKDVAERRARIALRPRGAGAQLLLLSLLKQSGYRLDALEKGPVCPTGSDVAQAIRAGRADCGIATRGVAAAAQLDFVPLTWERFDLVMRQRDYFRPPLQRLFAFMRSPAFAQRAAEMTGYDTEGTGSVRYVP